MELRGVVHDGVIVLDSPEPLAEGLIVKVVVEEPAARRPTLPGLLKHAGALADMPGDFAEEHDHYVHGTPKR